ncbi:MAG: hypothetical protein KZQ96_21470 [Candidatus Thiodiazotropha sp. (ex Lucinoma borealis)]|nr:hypothetical protein [Candidatus Thiodiazotropha sp. (ex Lucinoma borealis)]
MKKAATYHRYQLLQLLDVRHHELRAWLDLEPLASRTTKSRSATDYSILDALFLMVIKKLTAAGFPPKSLKKFSQAIYESLQKSLQQGVTDEIHLYQGMEGQWLTGTAPSGQDCVQIIVPIRQARIDVYEYTGAHLINPQGEMALLASMLDTKPPKEAAG